MMFCKDCADTWKPEQVRTIYASIRCQDCNKPICLVCQRRMYEVKDSRTKKFTGAEDFLEQMKIVDGTIGYTVMLKDALEALELARKEEREKKYSSVLDMIKSNKERWDYANEQITKKVEGHVRLETAKEIFDEQKKERDKLVNMLKRLKNYKEPKSVSQFQTEMWEIVDSFRDYVVYTKNQGKRFLEKKK